MSRKSRRRAAPVIAAAVAALSPAVKAPRSNRVGPPARNTCVTRAPWVSMSRVDSNTCLVKDSQVQHRNRLSRATMAMPVAVPPPAARSGVPQMTACTRSGAGRRTSASALASARVITTACAPESPLYPSYGRQMVCRPVGVPPENAESAPSAPPVRSRQPASASLAARRPISAIIPGASSWSRMRA